MIRAVIFDMDGTLIDSEEAHIVAWQRSLADLGRTMTRENELATTGQPTFEISLYLGAFHKVDPEEIMKRKRAHYKSLVHQGLPPIKPTVDFLRTLAAEKQRLNIRIGLASAAIKSDIILHLKQLEIEHLFDVILSGHDDLGEYVDPEGVNKPKPYIYLHAAKLLKAPPEQCVVIEDSATGVAAGYNAGCLCVAVPNFHTKHQDLSQAVLRIDSFEGIDVDSFFEQLRKKR